MKFYGYFRSSAAFRVRIAMNLKGVAPEFAFIHLRRQEQVAPAYTRVNPQQLVPALVLDDGTALAQSLAILEYLEETHPEPPILPRDPVGRARVRSLAMIPACEIHPIQNLRVLGYLGTACGQDEAGKQAWARHWIDVGFTAYEASVAGHPQTGRFSHGDAPTIADMCLVPQVFNARRFGNDLTRYPTLMRIFEACMAVPAFDQAQPAKQPDAEA
ncbi:maleylacetoacetate isomerase [Vineibacter terrae]|uniref:Maleylacetoacetate isomerase n=1 Tax=Vineibacter terrae TaxID=2586908 RepID=A0A5C8PK95_9HYPH|nr:maleylacetoacetate isomerase [Vineibacter terrae]TXL74296.1 maleylacetoacetate isomerase [Vineibacter terrae]